MASPVPWVGPPLPYLIAYDRTGLAPTPAERAVAISFPQGWFGIFPDFSHVGLGWLIIPLLVVTVIIAWRNATASVCGRCRLPLYPHPHGRGGYTLALLSTTSSLSGMFRYPERFSVIFLIPAVAFISLNLNALASQRVVFRYGLPVVLLLLVIASSGLFTSFPVREPLRGYQVYETIGKEPYDFAIVEIPTGGSSGEGIVGEREYSELEYYGLTHGKRMVNGHIARVNTYRYYYMRTDDPMLSWLGQRQLSDLIRRRKTVAKNAFTHGLSVILSSTATDLVRRPTSGDFWFFQPAQRIPFVRCGSRAIW